MVTVREILLAAADLIDQLGWTQHAPARDLHGNCVVASDPSALEFSLPGAIDRAAIGLDASSREHWHAFKQVAYTIAGMPVGVLAAFWGSPACTTTLPVVPRPTSSLSSGRLLRS